MLLFFFKQTTDNSSDRVIIFRTPFYVSGNTTIKYYSKFTNKYFKAISVNSKPTQQS